MGKSAREAAGGEDVRLRGFAERTPLATAWGWLDALPCKLAPERVAAAAAVGRILAEDCHSTRPFPAFDHTVQDGYAVLASACDGASPYNPLLLAWHEPGAARLPGPAACPVAAGWPLPEGADAVLPFEAAQRSGARSLEVFAAVAPGAGVERQGTAWSAGALILPRGRRVLPQDAACLTLAGLARVPVRRRPLIHLLVAGGKMGGDALTPMLLGLLARDGAEAEAVAWDTLREPPACDVLLVAGRSGTGPDDASAAALRQSGASFVMHGIALQPGGSAGMALWHGRPAILLPGEPAACLAAYDMLAGRLIRRLGGLPGEPYPVVACELGRKIVSSIGLTELVPVRLAAGRACPANNALLAGGFVVVDERSEGQPAGARAAVRLYQSRLSEE